MNTNQTLYQRLLQLDRQSYKAYKSIQGSYQFPNFQLVIDHVQGDPFAAPSRLRILMPQSKARFPAELYATHSREVALRDYINRQFDRVASNLWEKRGSGKSGLIAIASPGQQVLERSAVFISVQQLEARFTVGLPAQGRSILGRQAAELLCEDLPRIVERSLQYTSLNAEAIQKHVETIEDADWLRQQLPRCGLIAFIANGAILPRRSGVDNRPLETAIPFQSPPSLQVEFDRPNQGKISGMGIPQGITLIVGGGYHGKSTLLKAISLGVYNHIPNDGREQVVTDASAVKVRAEDGRSITGVNISPFINHLPQRQSTTQFSTTNASGSTSQAANIIEALEINAKVLLVDEDTSATNFMIRDQRMQALIAKDQEPITPFIDKIRQLYQNYGVSTVLVMGGSGDYFDVADTVIAITEFKPENVTKQAKTIAQQYTTNRASEGGESFGEITARRITVQRSDGSQTAKKNEIKSRQWKNQKSWQNEDNNEAEAGSRLLKLKVHDVNELTLGTETVSLAAVEQIVEVNQLRAIGFAVSYIQHFVLNDDALKQHCSLGNKQTLAQLVEFILSNLTEQGFDCFTPYPQGDLAFFRSHELAAVINRLRALTIFA